jgi:hypothetical protein
MYNGAMADVMEDHLKKLGFERWNATSGSFSMAKPFTKHLQIHIGLMVVMDYTLLQTNYCLDFDEQSQDKDCVHELAVGYEDPELMAKIEWFSRHGSILGYKPC